MIADIAKGEYMLGSKVINVEIAKLAPTSELAFHIRNRRNKQLGLWLASQLDLFEDALEYAKTIVAFGIAEADDEILIRHIQEDLSRREVRVPVAAIRFELEHQTTRAMREFAILHSRSAPGAIRSAA
jgi:hypothetical protein